ncbi:PAS domain-containing protein [Cesiribacter sp. SM1]|uniref:PAS domain-containing protein n=1 Tax=Cesiribacter sp. SM1 TaxID=2861196 RepID=UPI001CD3A835|nr:PAS domain-containing protein [Cesiribacter sp. SM1]
MTEIKQEEEERRWSVEGLARFVEILRNHNQDIDNLYNVILAELIKYLKANQGSLFVLNAESDEDSYLSMVACYAYDRRKFLSKRVEPGEGLVGQVYLEKESIYLTDIPADHIQITSGLGASGPRCLLIVPLKVNEQIFGVVEIASFTPLLPYQRDFIEKLGESIAATISSAKINERNKSLLELSQQQTAIMREQEEEMRQNLEELSATQEQMQRRMDESLSIQRELDARMQVLSKVALLTESDLYGSITYVNDKFCEVSGWSQQEVLGKPHSILRHPDNPKEFYKEMWATIKNGRMWQGRFPNRAKDGSTYWVDSAIAPVMDQTGKPHKYIGIRFDVTDQVNKEKELEELLNEMQQNREELLAQEEELRQNLEEIIATQEELHRQLNESQRLQREATAREKVFNLTTILSEADAYGTIIYVNDKLCEVSKYSREELIGKPHSIFRDPQMPKALFRLMWSTIKKGEAFRGIIKNRAKDGTHYWVDAVISPVLNEEGKPGKYIGTRYVIPDDTLAEMLFNRMIEELEIHSQEKY